MTNMQLAAQVIGNLSKIGVNEFCLCAGARNSPIIETFFHNPGIKTYHFFEERSAAFFALGRIASTRQPVAVVTTSGTAVAELLPATVEGTYSSLPLILITADRPKSYRGTGSPQTIEQVGLFSYYIEACFDLDAENTHISFKGLSWRKPVHINVCFQEPLLDGRPLEISISQIEDRVRFPETYPLEMVEKIKSFCENNNPLVIVSTLPEKAKSSVIEFLKKLQAPIYAEGISGLKNHPELKNHTILCGEKATHYLLDQKICNSLFRIGGVPTTRIWRDLEDKRSELPVLSVGYNHFTGVSREITHYAGVLDLEHIEVKPKSINLKNFFENDEKNYKTMLSLLEKYPQSEPSWIFYLSQILEDKKVYLGNSLPIRIWDLVADKTKIPKNIVGNRGANGIDGQISTFLGWAEAECDNWAIIGDLTALYDLSALWVGEQLESTRLNIVVINNKGGMIFKKIFGKSIFLNRHDIEFEHWAKMWRWNHLFPKSIADIRNNVSSVSSSENKNVRNVFEIHPNEKQTEHFWQEWDQLSFQN